jgi:crotonobetainyl-CoA:carnitine CoA-transferase CaiB-like acyl-CoA transferase
VKIDGNSRDGDAPRGLSCAGDENSCVVDVQNDAQFRGLAEAMDKPAWLACEDFRAPEGRLAHRGVIEEGLRSWTRRRSPRDVMRLLQQHGVPAGFMQRATEFHEDPHLIARGFLRPQEQPRFPDPLVTQDGEAAFSNIGRPLCGPAPAAQRRKW